MTTTRMVATKPITFKPGREIFTTHNLLILVIIGTYIIGGIASFLIGEQLDRIHQEGTSINDPENALVKTRLQQITIGKMVLMLFRLFVGKGIGAGNSGFSNMINVLVLFLIYGAASIENIEKTFNMVWSYFGDPVEFELEDFLARLNVVDMWIHVLGAANAITPMPKFVNSLISLAVIATQLPYTF